MCKLIAIVVLFFNQSEIGGDEFTIDAVAFHPSEHVFAMTDRAGKVAVVDPDKKKKWVTDLDRKNHGTALAFSHDGNQLIIGTRRGAVYYWDYREDRLEKKHTLGTYVRVIKVMPDGKSLAVGGGYGVDAGHDDGRLRVFRVADGHQLLSAETDTAVLSLACSETGEYLLAGNYAGELRVWKGIDKKQMVALHKNKLNAVQFVQKETRIVTCSADKTMKVFSFPQLELKHTLNAHSAGVTGVLVFEKRNIIVTGGGDKTVKIWNLTTHEEVAAFQAHDSPIRWLGAPKSQKLFATLTFDGKMRFWDTEKVLKEKKTQER